MKTKILWLSLLLIFTWCKNGTTKEINVPEEAETIQHAVEIAESGDSILVNSPKVDWVYRKLNEVVYDDAGILIKNKDLEIIGTLSNQKSEFNTSMQYEVIDGTGVDHPVRTTLWIENSHVVMKNVQLNAMRTNAIVGMIYSPIRIKSGTFELYDCKINSPINCQGNMIIENCLISKNESNRNYNNPNVGGPMQTPKEWIDYPAFLIGPATDIVLSVSDTLISSNVGIVDKRNMVIQDVHKSKMRFFRSKLQGGDFWNMTGSPGVEVINCSDLILDFFVSTIEGGLGRKGGYYTRGGYYHTVSTQGGSGILIKDSENIRIERGIFYGGPGGDARLFIPMAYTDYTNEKVTYDNGFLTINGGTGGNAVQIENSHVAIKSLNMYSGFGGRQHTVDNYSVPAGEDGKPLVKDASSTVKYLYKITTDNLK